MTNLQFLAQLQHKLHYQFQSLDLVEKVLQNRPTISRELALQGQKILEKTITNEARSRNIGYKNIQQHLKQIETHEYRATLAESLEINAGIEMYRLYEEPILKRTLSKAFNTIIGAVWKDSAGDEIALTNVITKLGLLVSCKYERNSISSDISILPMTISPDFFLEGQSELELSDLQAELKSTDLALSIGDTNASEDFHDFLNSTFTDQDEITDWLAVDVEQDMLGTTTSVETLSILDLNKDTVSEETRVTGHERQYVEDDDRQTKLQTPPVKRRRLNTQLSQSCDLVQHCIAVDQQRCLDAKINWSLFEPSIDTKYRDKAKTLYYALASPEAVVSFINMIKASREDQFLRTLNSVSGLRDRFRLIEKLDQRAALVVMIRRYHVLQLYIECGGPTMDNQNRFIYAVPIGKAPSPGNPLHKRTSQVTDSMMKELHPTLQKGHKDYNIKRKHVSNLRSLGMKLYDMFNRFHGFGFLGIMTRNSVCTLTEYGSWDDDKMIIDFPQSLFSSLIDEIDLRMGNLIRRMSAVVGNIVYDLCNGIERPIAGYSIEYLDPESIMRCPRTEDHLLALLFEAIPWNRQ